ncbi:hypothetical protein [Stappia sp. MMSF_3263]|uniref:hypothetical protein n=1 Tax=Stappia sp. MMSF_3263 TaxID=3046693 RepID=UPI00273D2AEB|nr:hypothetical protein [Stappia sp. MMSF_3263]
MDDLSGAHRDGGPFLTQGLPGKNSTALRTQVSPNFKLKAATLGLARLPRGEPGSQGEMRARALDGPQRSCSYVFYNNN